MTVEFALPELGEGITDADVLRVLVAPGDTVALDQPVLEIETEKATLDVPCGVSGRVLSIAVSEGETIAPGQLVLTVEEVDAPRSPPPPATAPPAASAPPVEAVERVEATPPIEAAPPDEAAPPTREPVTPPAAAAASAVEPPTPAPPATPERGQLPPFAAPSVRRFAREVGVEIRDVAGSGPEHRISLDDVKAHARMAAARTQQTAPTERTQLEERPILALPDFSRFGPVEREPLTRFRRTVARNMSQAWAEIPHVTLHHAADVTELEEIRRRYRDRAREAGGNLTLSVVILKIVAAALRAFPRMNSSLDVASNEIVLKRYYHLGVAVDTERGLAVPVIRDVDQKNVIELSVELNGIAGRAREGRLTLDEMQGASFTVSNLGSLGTGHFAPIINHPEVGVLGVGRAERLPRYIDGELQPRLIMPISLAHDHRVIDGADGARFMSWIVDAIREPLLLAFEG